MSMIDYGTDFRYTDTVEERITVADVLQKMKEDLAVQLAALAEAKRAVRHLQIAIDAVERDEAETQQQIEHQRPTRKRGELSRGVIEALREGIGTTSMIVRYLERQGIVTTPASVSNAIQRLQAKNQIHYDQSKQMWVLSASNDHSGHANGDVLS